MPRRTRTQRAYVEQLRDPRWQQVRLRALERAHWCCEWCGAADVNLQVHHGWYERGLKPWEYPGDCLFSLCDDCHARAESVRAEAHRALGTIAPWHHTHAVVLLRDLLKLLAEGVTSDELDGLEVQRRD